MTRPRVLHVFKTAIPESTGGVLTALNAIAAGLSDGFDQSFLIASNRGTAYFADHVPVPVSTVMHFGQFMSMPLAPGFPLRLRKAAKQADLVVLHAPFPLADLAFYLGAFEKVPVVVHWHAEIVRQSLFTRLSRPPVRRALETARRIIVSGEPLIAAPQLAPFAAKCTVVPFGVDGDFWRQLTAEDEAEIARMRTAHPRLVLAVGRLVSYKGFHVLVEAMKSVDAELWIVGRGPLKRDLGDRVAATGLGTRVRFHGEVPIERLRQLYHAAGVLALPSISVAETFGIVQIEAMSCGLPVVNTRLPTMVPVVARDGIEAITVSPENAGELATALTRILDDPALRARLSEAAGRRARDDFALRAFLDRIAAVYRGVLDG